MNGEVLSTTGEFMAFGVVSIAITFMTMFLLKKITEKEN